MEKEFIPYQEDLELKQLGFDEPCMATYSTIPYKLKEGYTHILRVPTYSQAFRFFRERYPHLNFGFGKIHPESENYHYHINYKWEFFEGSYEQAELACLKKLIEIVKQKQNDTHNN